MQIVEDYRRARRNAVKHARLVDAQNQNRATLYRELAGAILAVMTPEELIAATEAYCLSCDHWAAPACLTGNCHVRATYHEREDAPEPPTSLTAKEPR